MQSSSFCPNCSQPQAGEYCASCGERRLDRERLKLSSVASQVLEEVTNLDHSKLLRTFAALISRPGELTRAFLQGRRKIYLGPLKIFITVFALWLILDSIHQPTATYNVRKFLRQDQTGEWQQILQQWAAKAKMSPDMFISEANSRWKSYLSFSQILYPLILAITLRLLYLRSGQYFAEHLIFALHYLTFALVLRIFFWPARAFIGHTPSAYFVAMAILAAWWFAYLVLALRRVYGQSLLKSAIKAFGAFAAYVVATAVVLFSALSTAIMLMTRHAEN